MASRRIGLIGFGHIGRYIYEQITRHTAPGIALAFVTAEVRVELTVRVLEDDWMGIPVLPAGTPVVSAAANGTPAHLISSPEGPGAPKISLRNSGNSSRA